MARIPHHRGDLHRFRFPRGGENRSVWHQLCRSDRGQILQHRWINSWVSSATGPEGKTAVVIRESAVCHMRLCPCGGDGSCALKRRMPLPFESLIQREFFVVTPL